MKPVLRIALCLCLAAGVGLGQRGGGGGRMGGGGGFRGGGGFGGGGFRGGGGGFRGGGFVGGGFRGGGFRGGGFRGGWGRGFGPGWGLGWGGGWGGWGFPGWGLGWGNVWPVGVGGWGPGFADAAYPVQQDVYPAYAQGYQQPASNVTVIYPPAAQPAPVYVPATMVVREYDQYGNQMGGGEGPAPAAQATPGASPVYLIAFRDHSIRAAVAYWVDGNTLHYVTLQHESRQVLLSSIDNELSNQLNRERRVAFSLPVR